MQRMPIQEPVADDVTGVRKKTRYYFAKCT